jgi:hypothetical protein
MEDDVTYNEHLEEIKKKNGMIKKIPAAHQAYFMLRGFFILFINKIKKRI